MWKILATIMLLLALSVVGCNVVEVNGNDNKIEFKDGGTAVTLPGVELPASE